MSRRRRLTQWIRKLIGKISFWFYKKSQHAPDEPPAIHVVIPRQDFYEVWDKQIQEELKRQQKEKEDGGNPHN